LPQIVYYYAAFLRACKQNIIQPGEKINFCVPTGNFGNILAGYYAKRMGLPVNKLICASNRNNVLTDFFQSGKYDSNRPFYRSMSCSIDILVSSNLERLLFELTGRDNLQVSDWMNSLTQTGSYTIDEALTNKLHAYFYADWCNEDDTLATIRAEFDKSGYLMDPHTAVAQTIYHRYRETTGDETYTVLLSTAHPFKFSSGVLRAFETPCNHDDENNARLASITGHPVPPVIASLAQMPILHKKIVAIGDTPARVLEVLRP
ncbi:MAG: threonine synthase, partial [Clostridiales bacterium]|nr:threonine synthase [Clostridiales bacterium]